MKATLAEARANCKERALRDPYQVFTASKQNALAREIEWQLTFDEWWAIWRDYFHMRGRGTNDLCMGRLADAGPYAVGNVYLTTHLGNARDYSARIQATKRAQAERDERYWGKQAPLCAPCAKRSPLNI